MICTPNCKVAGRGNLRWYPTYGFHLLSVLGEFLEDKGLAVHIDAMVEHVGALRAEGQFDFLFTLRLGRHRRRRGGGIFGSFRSERVAVRAS